MSSLILSVLDQSPIHDGGQASEAPHNSTRLARACDQLGYHRYWLAEHHDTAGYAGTCPEILVAHIARETKRIRVGSGGVMLTHYSPLKVAEVFRMLESLHPGRIDLGVGRAPGGNFEVASALAFPYEPSRADLYGRQVYDLSAFLHGEMPQEHPFQGVEAQPVTKSVPPLWLLGSGDGSAVFAGQMGAGLALALFIGTHDRSPAILQAYRDAFVPSPSRKEPEAMIAVAVTCAPSHDEAVRIAATHTYWKVQAFQHSVRIALLPPDDCLALREELSLADQRYYDETLATMVVGTPAECRAELEALARDYGTGEICVVNVSYSFADRLRSYQLLAEEFGISSQIKAQPVSGAAENRQ